MIFISLAIGWIFGLLLAAGGITELYLAGPAVVAGIAALRVRWMVWLLLALVAATLADLRYQAYWNGQRDADVAAYTERSVVQVQGVVAADPAPYGIGLEFPLDARWRERGGQWFPSRGAVMVRVVGSAPYQVGDRLIVDGVLLTPDPQLPPYQSSLRQQGIVAVADRPTVQVLGNREVSPLELVARVRTRATTALDQALPEPEAGLARGITLGEPRSIGPDLANDFSQTNTSHILAVDGYKVSLVASVVESVLTAAFRPMLAAGGTVLGIGLYTLLVGASPSALRASIMGGVYVLGQALGRPRDTLNALAVAALAMTAVNPFLLWNLAFQLSFVTTLGMSALAPIVGSWLPHRKGAVWEALHEAVGATVAAEVASAPLVVAAFNHLSLVSLPVHAVVMPLLPFAIGLSALTAAFGSVAPAAGNALGLLAWFPLAAIVTVVQWAGALPFAALAIPQLGLGVVLAAYAGLGLVLFSRPNPLTGPGLPLAAFWRQVTSIVPGRVLVPALVLPLALAGAVLLHRPAPTDQVSFLDVGAGDAALVQLVDGGRFYVQDSAGATQAARAVGPALPFWDRAIPLAALTAGDDQALAGLDDLAGRLTIQRVIVPTSGFSAVAEKHWQATAAQRQIAVIPGRNGMRVALGPSAVLNVYALAAIPARGRTAAREPGLALRLALARTSVLWASAEPADQALLVAAGVPLSAQILKLAGQSSRWGLDPGFFQRVNPSIVVLPAGASGKFAKPTPGTLDLLANRRVYRTDQDGTIVIAAAPNGLTVETSR
ncbi:MAG TPA: ComEC/Rec2 family competence protein [Chloroflexota bacterium]|nr:ComEC/Rec2 family competence protein [Chloroflexota bacterium]